MDRKNKKNESQEEEQKYLVYMGRPMVKKGNDIYYGKKEEKYYVFFKLESFEKVNNLKVANSITVKLMTNEENEESKLIKQAKRENLTSALELAETWLSDALVNH